MKNRTIINFQRNLTWLLVVILVVLVVDPFGVLSRGHSADSYSQIRRELSKTKNANVQIIASWDDFYSLEYNNYWRSEMNQEFVEGGYNEVLDAASLGDNYLHRYLQLNEITHVLVPKSTELHGRIYHKFGNRGSINITIPSQFFLKVAESFGPFASVLFLVVKNAENISEVLNPGYSLNWFGVSSDFYQKQDSVVEVGMYNYEYRVNYENGPNVSWFWDQLPNQSNSIRIEYESRNNNLKKVNIEIDLVAAYGPNAPSHVVVVSATNFSTPVLLIAGSSQTVSINLEAYESVKLSNATPCRLPSRFEPSDATLSEICFGISAVRVTPITPAG